MTVSTARWEARDETPPIGPTVTVTTAVVHGLAVGDLVTVSGVEPSGYNGTFIVQTVPSTRQFTHCAADSGTYTSGGNVQQHIAGMYAWGALYGEFRYPNLSNIPIGPAGLSASALSTASWAAGVATITTNGVHGLSVGDLVVISGITPSPFNGTFVVQTVPSLTRSPPTWLPTPVLTAAVGLPNRVRDTIQLS